MTSSIRTLRGPVPDLRINNINVKDPFYPKGHALEILLNLRWRLRCTSNRITKSLDYGLELQPRFASIQRPGGRGQGQLRSGLSPADSVSSNS